MTIEELKTLHTKECECTHQKEHHLNGRGRCNQWVNGYFCSCKRFKKACRGTCDHFETEEHHPMAYKPPFHFDGHGINDAEGTRLATLNTQAYTYDTGTPVRNPEHEELGALLGASHELLTMAHTIDVLDGEDMTDPANVSHLRGCIVRAKQLIKRVESAGR